MQNIIEQLEHLIAVQELCIQRLDEHQRNLDNALRAAETAFAMLDMVLEEREQKSAVIVEFPLGGKR